MLTCIALWVVLVLCAAALWQSPLTLTAIYIAGSAVCLVLWWSKQAGVMYACGFVLGPGGELVAVAYGAWEYAEALFLIPLWLPPAWGLAALILFRLATSIGPESRRT